MNTGKWGLFVFCWFSHLEAQGLTSNGQTTRPPDDHSALSFSLPYHCAILDALPEPVPALTSNRATSAAC